MGARVFTDEGLVALRRFPEIGREELSRFFTLTRRIPRDSSPKLIEAKYSDGDVENP